MDQTIPTKADKKSVYLTSQGFEQLRQELDYLVHKKRIELSERFQQAREMDNTEESAEFDAVADEMTMVEQRISELEKILRNAKIVDHHVVDEDTVDIGSTVIVEIDGNNSEFIVVGRLEANPSQKKISNESPMGEALFGSKKGAVVTVKTPLKSYTCKILDIK